MDRIHSTLGPHVATITASLGVGVVIGWLFRSKFHTSMAKALSNRSRNVVEELVNEDISVETKMVIVIRSDLKMGKGKACAQASHASVLAYEQIRKEKMLFNTWRLSGQRKVVVKVDDLDEFNKVADESRRSGLNTCVIRDAGHTQVDPGTITCMAVGPAPASLVDKVTGHLKLY